MKNDEIKKDENLEMEEKNVIEETKVAVINDDDEIVNESELNISEDTKLVENFNNEQINNSITRKKIQTTVTDMKVLFNTEDHIDYKLNDMEGKEINVVDVIMKTYEKDVPEFENEFTGEIETVERKITTILIDDTNTTYVTGSKLFAMRIMQLMQIYKNKIHDGIKIRITKTEHKKGNKKLGFEIL